VDITFAHPEDVEQVGLDNCRNTSGISFNLVFGTASLSGSASSSFGKPHWAMLGAVVAAGLALL
jgi:hypothetical protein